MGTFQISITITSDHLRRVSNPPWISRVSIKCPFSQVIPPLPPPLPRSGGICGVGGGDGTSICSYCWFTPLSHHPLTKPTVSGPPCLSTIKVKIDIPKLASITIKVENKNKLGMGRLYVYIYINYFLSLKIKIFFFIFLHCLWVHGTVLALNIHIKQFCYCLLFCAHKSSCSPHIANI